MQIFIEDTSNDRFECDIPEDTRLDEIAADFFEERGWPTTDSRGRGQRAVVELVDPNNPDRTKRLDGVQNADEAGLWDGAVLRIFPESIAGALNEQNRIRDLVADHQDMNELVGWNHHISFTTNMTYAPTQYTISFDYPSIVGLKADGHTPIIRNEHQVEITMGAGYPESAPWVRWLTPIFHPNIDPADGEVCLGVLRERYLPGLGLARIVTMLAEMLQFRNFDMSNAFNKEAARWTFDPELPPEKLEERWNYIRQIGGNPFQGPIGEIADKIKNNWTGAGRRPRITFTRTSKTRKTS